MKKNLQTQLVTAKIQLLAIATKRYIEQNGIDTIAIMLAWALQLKIDEAKATANTNKARVNVQQYFAKPGLQDLGRYGTAMGVLHNTALVIGDSDRVNEEMRATFNGISASDFANFLVCLREIGEIGTDVTVSIDDIADDARNSGTPEGNAFRLLVSRDDITADAGNVTALVTGTVKDGGLSGDAQRLAYAA